MDVKIKIKPMSVNKAWQGKRFKTPAYKSYEKTLGLLLPAYYPMPEGKLRLRAKIGFSSKSSDLDNCIKPMIDILQKAYDFNDKMIYAIDIEKEIVKKGEDYISFSIEEYYDHQTKKK